nr:flagellar biosynthesis regulator FlaF [Amylibacter sp.]
MSLSAYKQTLKATEPPRSMERRILNQLNARLGEYQAAYDATPEGGARLGILAGGLREALHDNVSLWMEFKTDLSNPGNTLPPEMRANLLSLAIYVERQTGLVLKGQGTVKALMDVNAPIIVALQGQGSEAA